MKKRGIIILVLLLMLVSLSACSNKSSFIFECDNKEIIVSLYASNYSKEYFISNFEDKYFLLKDNKESTPETTTLKNNAQEMMEETKGYYNCYTKPLSDIWGFSNGDYRIPDSLEIEQAIERVNNKEEIDLSHIYKGYLADCLKDYLKEISVNSAIVDMGDNNILVFGKKNNFFNYKIGLSDPLNPELILASVSCANCVISSASQYQEYFMDGEQRYGHIIDPTTGYPIENDLLEVIVISEDGYKASSLANAMYVMGKEKAIEFFKDYSDISVILICEDTILISSDLSNSFTLLVDNYVLEEIK